MKSSNLSRRSFLGLGAAAVAGAGLAGCAPAGSGMADADAAGAAANAGQDLASTANPTEFVPAFLNAPEPIAEDAVAETIDVDVCVVGLGLAGVCALREAAEQGAKVVGIDKGTDLGYRSGEFGTFGSAIHAQLGIEQPETQEVVNELMRVMGNRPNAQLLNYWIANSGPDLDWYIGNSDFELLTSDSDTPTDPESPYVFPERCPVNDNYDWRAENYPCFPGMVHLLPDHGWALRDRLRLPRPLAPRPGSTPRASSSSRKAIAWWVCMPRERTVRSSALMLRRAWCFRAAICPATPRCSPTTRPRP